LVLGAAYAVLPRRRAIAALLGAAGAIAAFSSFFLGCALVIAADLAAGGEMRVRALPRDEAGATASPWRLALRASASRLPEAWALAVLPVIAGLLFTRNNVLPPELLARGARLGIGSGIVVVLGVMADRLAVLRPVWRWARSLPSTSRRRVVE